MMQTLVENRGEILLLQRSDRLQRFHLFLRCIRQNHAPDRRNAGFVKEHMLGPAESDALRTERERLPRITRIVGIGSDFQFTQFIRPFHDRLKITGQRRDDSSEPAVIHLSGTAVDR